MFLATLQCQKETNNKTKQKKNNLAIKGPNRNSKKPDGKKKEKDETYWDLEARDGKDCEQRERHTERGNCVLYH